MTDEEKIEKIINNLENGYEFNPHSVEEQRIILDMKWLINYAKSTTKRINTLKINEKTARENSRRSRKQNKYYRESLERIAHVENGFNILAIEARMTIEKVDRLILEEESG